MEQLNKRMEINGIPKTFFNDKGYFTAMKDVSFDVSDDEFPVILGPGRCGKAVLLNVITGLEQQTGGTVVYSGREWKGVSPEISMVFQRLALMSFKMVVENVELGPKFHGMSKEQRRKLAQRYIELVGLKGFEKSYPTQLSGGMRQKVGITRAYTANPKLLITGEPFRQLDVQTRYQMQEGILGIWEKEKRTVIFVTNDIKRACYLGDGIILFNDCLATVKGIYPTSIPRSRGIVSEEFPELHTIISDSTDLAI